MRRRGRGGAIALAVAAVLLSIARCSAGCSAVLVTPVICAVLALCGLLTCVRYCVGCHVLVAFCFREADAIDMWFA